MLRRIRTKRRLSFFRPAQLALRNSLMSLIEGSSSPASSTNACRKGSSVRTFDEHPVVQALRLAHAELPEEEEVREEMGLYHLAKMYRAYVDGKVDIPPELRRAALSSIRSERGWGENEEPDIPLNRL